MKPVNFQKIAYCISIHMRAEHIQNSVKQRIWSGYLGESELTRKDEEGHFWVDAMNHIHKELCHSVA